MECRPYNGTEGLLFFEMPHHFFSKISLISNDYSSNNCQISWGKKNLNKKIGRALCWAMFIEHRNIE